MTKTQIYTVKYHFVTISALYLLIIFLLRYRCLTHLCLCLPSDILFVHEIWLNISNNERGMLQIFADLELFNSISILGYEISMAERNITHTLKLRNTSPGWPTMKIKYSSLICQDFRVPKRCLFFHLLLLYYSIKLLSFDHGLALVKIRISHEFPTFPTDQGIILY